MYYASSDNPNTAVGAFTNEAQISPNTSPQPINGQSIPPDFHGELYVELRASMTQGGGNFYRVTRWIIPVTRVGSGMPTEKDGAWATPVYDDTDASFPDILFTHNLVLDGYYADGAGLVLGVGGMEGSWGGVVDVLFSITGQLPNP